MKFRSIKKIQKNDIIDPDILEEQKIGTLGKIVRDLVARRDWAFELMRMGFLN